MFDRQILCQRINVLPISEKFTLILIGFLLLIRNQVAEMALNLESIDDCIQDLIDLTEDYKQLEVENAICILIVLI